MALEGKAAIITGAASGFGRKTAEHFTEEGANVVAVDIDGPGLEATARQIEDADTRGDIVSVEANVTDSGDIAAFVHAAIEEFDQIDVLFNNAGTLAGRIPIEELSKDVWDRSLEVNLTSVFLVSKTVIPHMREHSSGAIVNNATISAKRPRDDLAAYVASKAGVRMLTKELALELAPDGIRANVINPVASPTPLLDSVPAKRLAAVAETIPLGRMAKPDDIAHAVAFLADDERAGMITGIDLDIDGGRGI